MTNFAAITQLAPVATGNDDFIVGFQPDFGLFFGERRNQAGGIGSSHNSFYFGVTDGTSQGVVGLQSQDAAGTTATWRTRSLADTIVSGVGSASTVEHEANVGTTQSTGMRLNFTTASASSDRWINHLAIGGANVSVHSLDVPTSGATVAKTGLAFQPKLLIVLAAGQNTADEKLTSGNIFMSMGVADGTSQWCLTVQSVSGSAADDSRTRFSTDRLGQAVGTAGELFGVSLTSIESDGYTLGIDDLPSASTRLVVAAIGGADFNPVVGVGVSPTSVSTQAVTGLGIDPEALLLVQTANTAAQDGTSVDDVNFGVGIAQQSSRFCTGTFGDDAADPTDHAQYYDDLSIVGIMATSSTMLLEADLDSFDTGGFTLDWTNVDATARRYGYVAMQGAAGGTGNPWYYLAQQGAAA